VPYQVFYFFVDIDLKPGIVFFLPANGVGLSGFFRIGDDDPFRRRI